LFDLLIEALENERPVARRHRARVQSEVQRVVEEGIASGAFAMTDRRRAMALIFDAAHRFIHPIALKLDKDVAAAALAARCETVVATALRTLRIGRA
jgi:hypothetical protein